MTCYEDQVQDVLANAKDYHDAYYAAATFSGPSLFFHQRALQARGPDVSTAHLEYVYAALAAWGMHRMGRGGSKMQSFAIFENSVRPLRSRIAEAQQFEIEAMTEGKWHTLKSIFQAINAMASGTTIVGNSKVMHHMMPNIVPPIDRQYTLKFLQGNGNVTNDLESEWRTMRSIIADFFIPVAGDKSFVKLAKGWIAEQGAYPWDTSLFKVVDNLVIGRKQNGKRQEG